MPDFVEILKKTLQGLGETTPEIRQKVYHKARETVESRLYSMDPPLSHPMIQEKRNLLEVAIVEVEKSFCPQAPSSVDPFGDLASIFDSFPNLEKKSLSSLAATPVELATKINSSDVSEKFQPVLSSKKTFFGMSLISISLVVFLLLALCGGAFFLFEKNQKFYAFFNWGESNEPVVSKTLEEEKDKTSDIKPDQIKESEGQILSETSPKKFTSRLHSDGTETNSEPAVSSLKNLSSVNEGFSAAPLGFSPDNPLSKKNSLPAVKSEKAIFYEEGVNSSATSALSGSVVWSIVQESPGSGIPAEPAIQGESVIPEKGIRLRMTIRRNADRTLPASHIIEIIFIGSKNNQDDPIDKVDRILLKAGEQDTGSPLGGISAKISDGFFLIALDQAKKALTDNLELLKQKLWIDIPMVYKSGRRALITVEKGASGSKVFDDVLKAWTRASAVSAHNP